jgi:hypothetical protein
MWALLERGSATGVFRLRDEDIDIRFQGGRRGKVIRFQDPFDLGTVAEGDLGDGIA